MLAVVVGGGVVVVDDHLWKASWGSYFDRFAGRLSLSLRLTQGNCWSPTAAMADVGVKLDVRVVSLA